MAAGSDQSVDADAVPISFSIDAAGGLLPDWYMPAASSPVRGPVRRALIGGIVLALLVINSVGLCVTYGFAEIAW